MCQVLIAAPRELPGCDPSFAGHRVGYWNAHLDIGLCLPQGVVVDERRPWPSRRGSASTSRVPGGSRRVARPARRCERSPECSRRVAAPVLEHDRIETLLITH